MPLVHRHRLRVRYSECDPQGIVFNAHYLTYFDVALTELWRDAAVPYPEMRSAGIDMVVASATARFRAPAGFDDELDIERRIARLGMTSIVTAQRVTRGDELVVEGEMRHVFMDLAERRKAPIPDVVRRALTPYTANGDEPG